MAIITYHLHGNSSSRGSRIKKLLLWLLLIVQLCFIFCFWMLQTTYQDHAMGEMHLRKTSHGNNNNKKSNEFKGNVPENTYRRVHFLAKPKAYNNSTISLNAVGNTWENVNNFNGDYLNLNINRLIYMTGIETEMKNEAADTTEWARKYKYICCFQEGTSNDSSLSSLIYWNIDAQSAQCKCRKYWHGKDCGQPEVIWRALILPGRQFKIREIRENMSPHRLVYMLEGYFHSLDLLELQIKSLENIVDQFLIYSIASYGNEGSGFASSSSSSSSSMFNSLQRRLNAILSPQRFIVYYCNNNNNNNNNNRRNKNTCSTIKAFKYFKKQLKIKFDNQLMASDLFLYSNENIIYAREPLKFLKYYSTMEMPVWRFRLKHNVYGFYWQHPARTHLSGFICSFGYLESTEKRLPNLLKTKDDRWSTEYYTSSSVIGDLNHYGGWFCQYCEHPDEILKDLLELSNDSSSSYMKFEFPNGTRNSSIDAKYLEYLIAHGLHIDGRTQLIKIRQYNDKYFAPTYTEMCKWKFGNILTNLFEAMESDYILEEAEGGAGF